MDASGQGRGGGRAELEAQAPGRGLEGGRVGGGGAELEADAPGRRREGGRGGKVGVDDKLEREVQDDLKLDNNI